MLTEPKIIILDEPTKGLDPHSTANLHGLIKNHLIEKLVVTVFLTSHQLKEVEDLYDYIAIMNHGKIQDCGTIVNGKCTTSHGVYLLARGGDANDHNGGVYGYHSNAPARNEYAPHSQKARHS